MIPITDQELDDTWRATTDNEIALCEWHECMNEAEAAAMLERSAGRLASWLVAMMGHDEYMAAVELQDLRDAMEDELWHSRGAW